MQDVWRNIFCVFRYHPSQPVVEAIYPQPCQRILGWPPPLEAALLRLGFLSGSCVEFSRKLCERTEAMKKGRFSEEQIIGILKQGEAGVKTADVCREHGISAATFYGWKQKFGGMEVERGAAVEGDGRREPPSEAAGGGAEPAWRGAEGCDPKKRLELAGLRADVAFAQAEYPSERTHGLQAAGRGAVELPV